MSMQYMGELRIMSFNFPPKGWAFCNGQILPIAQNQALFSLLGVTYGGNGVTTFALPDLRTTAAGHASSTYPLGAIVGAYSHTLTQTEMPQHMHFMRADSSIAGTSNASTAATNNILGQTAGKASGGGSVGFNLWNTVQTPTAIMAPQALGVAGGSQPHENRQPTLTLNYCISLQGIYPSRN